MSDVDLSQLPEGFSGRARLFPLPELVVFPHVMQPLHIFEPRYREMLEDALAGDKLIAMAQLTPGSEQDYLARPPLRPCACLCRVATHERQADGTYNILILGLRRVRLLREAPPTRLFRVADVELLDDIYPPVDPGRRSELQLALLAGFKKVLPNLAAAQQQLDQLLGSQITLGMLTDIVAYTLQLELEVKVRLLAEQDVDRRARLLLEQLPAARDQDDRAFPPDFSLN